MRKKVFCVLIAVMLGTSLVLGACAAPAPAPAPTPAPAPVPAPAPAAAPEVITWTIQNSHSVAVPSGPFAGYEYVGNGSMANLWSEWLFEATNGRLKVDVVEAQSLFPRSEAATAIGEGVIEAAANMGGWHSGSVPEGYVEGGLPFAWQTMEEIWDCYYNPEFNLAAELSEVYDQHNIVFVPAFHTGYCGIGANFPIPDPDAIKGKKLRSFGAYLQVLEELGAAPVALPYGEVYMACQLGTVDGFAAGLGGLWAAKFQEVVSNALAYPDFGNTMHDILINKQAFYALPEDIQQIIVRDTPHVTLQNGLMYRMLTSWAIANAEEEYGLKVWKWSEEDTKEVSRIVIEKVWPTLAEKSPNTSRLVDIVKRWGETYGKW